MQYIIIVISGFFFFTKVANPDFDPSIAGAPSVHTPVNADQDSSSFSKNFKNMFL